MPVFLAFIYGSLLLTTACIHYLLLRRFIDPSISPRIRLFPSLIIAYLCAAFLAYGTFVLFLPFFFLAVGIFPFLASGITLGFFGGSFYLVLTFLQPSIRPRYIIAVTGVFWLIIFAVYFTCAVFLKEYIDADFLLVASLLTLSLPSVMGISYWLNISWQKATIRFVIIIVGIVSAIVLVMIIYALATNGGRVNKSPDDWVTYTDTSAEFSLSYPDTLLPKSTTGAAGEKYVRFYANNDPDIPSISVTVAPAVRQSEPQLEAPLYRSCTGQALIGVVDFQSRNLSRGVMTERFLDKNSDGMTGNYIFVARNGDSCYIIRAIGPGYRMHMNDIEKLLDSFSII